MTGMIDTKQIELHFEKANMAADTIDRGRGMIVLGVITAGKSLLDAKGMVPHGEWSLWLSKHWDHSQSLASKYMKIANSEHVPNLKDAKSMREALSLAMLSDEEDQPDVAESAIVPRAERKTGRVEVAEVGQTVVQADHVVPVSKMVDENAVAAEPKTNTKHSPAIAKAKEADRPAPMPVTPVIVDEPEPSDPIQEWIETHTLADLVFLVIAKTASSDDAKAKAKAAKELRKLADTLDPPAEGKTPSRSQLVSMIPDDWAPELQKAAADWAEYKQARAKGERIQTLRAWELALDKFTKQPMATVVSKVNNAIEKSWKGWDHDTANQQSGGAIAGTGRIKPGKIDESQIEWR